MVQSKETGEVTKMNETALLVAARKRLRSALELLGTGDETTVLDEAITGAGILAHDAGDVLEALFELRLEGEAAGRDGKGEHRPAREGRAVPSGAVPPPAARGDGGVISRVSGRAEDAGVSLGRASARRGTAASAVEAPDPGTECAGDGEASRGGGGAAARGGLQPQLPGTGITNFMENGGSIDVAAGIAGHASTKTTQLYNRSAQTVQRDEIERVRS